MKDISLNKDEFQRFNEFDQFGFFYDDDGFPRPDALESFNSDVDSLYEKYETISVSQSGSISGITGNVRELLMDQQFDAYELALEVKAPG